MFKVPTAILFDLDDTILAYDLIGDVVWRNVCQAYAHRIKDVEIEKLLRSINKSRKWFWGNPVRHQKARLNLIPRYEIVEKALSQIGVTDKGLAQDMENSYEEQRIDAVRPFPDAIATLAELRRRKIGLALVTNGASETQRAKIERFDLADYFQYILIEGELGFGKPDDRIYQHALDKLGTAPGETWMVGDRLEWEVSAPQRLGMKGIWLDSGRGGLPKDTHVQPDRIIHSISELLDENPGQSPI